MFKIGKVFLESFLRKFCNLNNIKKLPYILKIGKISEIDTLRKIMPGIWKG